MFCGPFASITPNSAACARIALINWTRCRTTLSGAVEWTQPDAPSFDDAETEGAATARAAAIPVTLVFTVAGSPLS